MFHPQMAEDLALTKHSLANHHDLLLPSGKRMNYLKLLYIQILNDQQCLGINILTRKRSKDVVARGNFFAAGNI
jgi:hypothetical protein